MLSPGDRSTIRFSIAADPSTLNPLFAIQDASSVDQQVARLAFEPFVEIDAQGRRRPVLLRAIPTVENGGVSRDGRTITYRLRAGVRWQDGAPLTSRDVVFTWHAILDPGNPVRSRAGYDRIARIDTPDPLTAIVRLRDPWAPAVDSFFAFGTAPQFVLPAHLLEKEAHLAASAFGSAPVGDGPFRLRSWRRGERLEYDANPAYWRGAPHAAHLEVAIVPDPSTNLTLLRSFAIDWNLVAPSQLAALDGTPGLRFVTTPLALVAGIALNVTRPPLDDVRIRRALAASIDREAISRKITLGRYRVADSAQPFFSWARDPAALEPAYDPAAADALFRSAGWRPGRDGVLRKAGKPLALTYVQFPETQTGVRAAALIQSDLRRRGVAVTLKSVSNALLFLPAERGGLLASGNFDMAYVPWPLGADPDDSFIVGCRGHANFMRYCSPEVDRLEELALRAPSREERRAAYSRISRIVAADVPVIYLFNPTYTYTVRAELAGFAPNPFTPTWDAFDWAKVAPAPSPAGGSDGIRLR
jgi:peptide/nickel transport system substrate-binding protein